MSHFISIIGFRAFFKKEFDLYDKSPSIRGGVQESRKTKHEFATDIERCMMAQNDDNKIF